MNLSPKKRWGLLLGVLAITMASAWLAPDENENAEPAVPVKKSDQDGNRGKRANTDSVELHLEQLQRTGTKESEPQPEQVSAEEASDMFPSKSWVVPPPPPKPVPPAPPAPPPIPFTLVGKMLMDGKPVVFLSKQERNLVVREGDVIEGSYRVESINPPVMTLIYLPMKMKQTIQIGAFN